MLVLTETDGCGELSPNAILLYSEEIIKSTPSDRSPVPPLALVEFQSRLCGSIV